MHNPTELLRAEIATIPANHAGLVREIMDELNDEKYMSLRHGERHTRNRGCKGPLCQKAQRDWWREHHRRDNKARGLATRPYRRSTLYLAVEPIIAAVKAIHDKEFDARRLAPKELQTSGAGQ